MTTITLTLTGSSHLIGFSAFSVLEVRRARWARPGRRVLCGPFHRQPELGVPTPLPLKPDTRALLVVARSASDRTHDVFLPLVPAAGASVLVPMIAPSVGPGLADRLAQHFHAAPWIFAESYRGGDAEHEYTRRRDWASDDDFVEACEAIARHGYRHSFHGGWWTALDANGYRHWTGWQEPSRHTWINRRRLDGPAVPYDVTQMLVVQDACRLTLPATDDPWRALAVALFGSTEPLRPRLVRRPR